MDAMDKVVKTIFEQRSKRKVRVESPEERAARIELYANRAAAGLDIWTGKRLRFGVVEGDVELA
jgi:hypothetical protein